MLEIKDECTGCMACMNICPTGAITQTINEYGFVMPTINMDKCIGCNKCESVCCLMKSETHFVETKGEKSNETFYPIAAYSMYSKDEAVVSKSSSGGAFYTLANKVIEDGGVVFGCYYDESKKSAYLIDTDHIELDKILTSKYVESYIGKELINVKAYLDGGRKVLFCGTPCQCAGLKAFLGREYDNLLIVDFTCGAVTAQTPLADYLSELEGEYQSKVTRLNFRDKMYGWGQYCMAVDFENGEKYRKTAMYDSYFFCFLRSSMQRLSCHGCRFSNQHASDIVLADFWRFEHFDIDANDYKGLSLVLAMNEKGKQAIDDIEELVNIKKLDVKKAAYNFAYRDCPNSKREEIATDQYWAAKYGVRKLREKLLSSEEINFYEKRQQVMDKGKKDEEYYEMAGNGQIVRA